MLLVVLFVCTVTLKAQSSRAGSPAQNLAGSAVPGSAEGGEGVDVGNGGTAGFFGLHSPWSRLVFAERLQCVVSPGQGVADAVPASPFHLPLSHNPPEGKNSTGS